MKWRFKRLRPNEDIRLKYSIESSNGNISANLFQDERGQYMRMVNWKTNQRKEVIFPFVKRTLTKAEFKKAVERHSSELI